MLRKRCNISILTLGKLVIHDLLVHRAGEFVAGWNRRLYRVVHRCVAVSREQQMRSCLSFSGMGLRVAELVGKTPNYWSFFAFFSIPILSTARQDSSQVTCCFHVFNNSLRCIPCPRVTRWKCSEGKLLNMTETLNIWLVASIIYLALIGLSIWP